MAEIDAFANQLLEEAKRFLEKARESPGSESEAANLHASLMLGFCALEAHINAVAEEFSNRPELSAHEKGILLERDVRLENGEFRLTPALRIARLEDRIQFLHLHFSGREVDRSSAWWGELGSAITLRNELTHAKDVPNINIRSVSAALKAIIDTLSAIYEAIYKRPFPPAARVLQSRLTF